MNLSDEMLETAMKKAVEAGLLPRHASSEDRYMHRELMRFILQAALERANPVSAAMRCMTRPRTVQQRPAGIR